MDKDHEAEPRLVVAKGILSDPPPAEDATEESGAATGETISVARPPNAHGPVSPTSATEPGTPANPGHALGGASTMAAKVSARGSRDERFPVANWDRYECVRFLGHGGMGKVFLARDLQLRREVAIKFVRGDNPRYAQRLISEARAQARVNHDRVCKVYEVGEVEGHIYIAMQYIAGRPLSALVSELTIEQKAIVLRDAAHGLHEAHRAGFIHRDVKPGNIMLERTEDGALKPYVLDFGLAREWKDDLAETGTVLGTPDYMSPEQARGEVKRLDRRADVYSLGATLYHLLAGEPPLSGSNTLEVLNKIANLEPPSLRARNPDIPVDLEAITLRCLEKERSARYDSARALAEDLDRFLSGDPVQARPAGVWYRLRKKLLKHRGTAALVAAALTLLLFTLGWGLAARREVALRERLARRFTEQVEHIEARARYAALVPLHDVRTDRSSIRTEMAELEAEIREAGPIALGPGHYALGRGALALGDEAKAREYLESAWQHGFREPRVAYELALVMGHLYQEELQQLQLPETERTLSPEARAARKRDIVRRYRDPALMYLRQSGGVDAPSMKYVAALIAFYEDRFDEALRHLDAIGGGLPWFYEAPALRGDIFLARASQHSDQGQRDGALADFAAGRRAYASAAAIGESVPAVHEALGELEHAAMRMELHGQGDVMPSFDRGFQAVSRALQADPDHAGALLLKARLQRRLAEYRTTLGGDAEALLAQATAAAEKALAAAPMSRKARQELGRCYWQWGNYRQMHGQDPREQLGKAIAALDGIDAKDRDYDFHLDRGLAFDVWADYEDLVGADSLPNRERAIESGRTAARLDERQLEAWTEIGTAYFKRASHPRCKDPEGDLAQARAAFDKARAINPQHIVPYLYGFQIQARLAGRQRAHGQDARPALAMALDLCRQGLAIAPKLPHFHNGVGSILFEQAKEAWLRGEDPDPLLAQARTAFEQAIAAAPEQGFAYINIGEVLRERAAYQRARGENPGPTVREAVTALRHATEKLPGYAAAWATLGSVFSLEAAFQVEHGQNPQQRLAEAAAALGNALSRNQNDSQTHLYLGETGGIRARWQARLGKGRSEDFEAAAQAFEKALVLAPEDEDARLRWGHFCRAWGAWQKAAGRDPAPPLGRGLEEANRVLAARPEWPEARLLRASLLLAQAESESRPEARRELGGQALQDFAKAMGANRQLERVWRDRVAAAQRLTAAPRD